MRQSSIKRKFRFFSISIASLILGSMLLSFFPVSTDNYGISGKILKDLRVPERAPLFANDPNGPQITIDTPANESIVTGYDGKIPFHINVTFQGAAGGAILDKLAQIYINSTWWNMVDGSNGNFSYFTFSSDFSAPSWDGVEVEVKFNVTNSLWFSNIYTLNITIDNSPPDYTIHSPQPNQYVTSDLIFSVEASDALSGVEWVNVTIEQLFGGEDKKKWKDINLTYNSGSDRWEYYWKVVQNGEDMGPYNLTFTIIDEAGVETSESVTVTVEYTPPDLMLLSPSNMSSISGITKVSIQTIDSVSGIDQFTLQVGSGAPVSLSSSTTNIYDYDLNTKDLSEGSVDLTIRSINHAGLESQILARYFVDNSKPIGIVQGSFQAVTGNQQFQLVATDPSGFSQISWRIDEKPYHHLPTTTGTQNFTIPSWHFTDGNHTLYVLLRDGSTSSGQYLGNELLLIYDLTIDNTAPNIAVRNLNYGDSIPSNYRIQIDVYEHNDVRLYYTFDEGEIVEITRSNENESWYLDISVFKVSGGNHYLRFIGIDIVGFEDVDEFIIEIRPVEPYAWWIWVIIGGLIVSSATGLFFLTRHIKIVRVARTLESRELFETSVDEDKNVDIGGKDD